MCILATFGKQTIHIGHSLTLCSDTFFWCIHQHTMSNCTGLGELSNIVPTNEDAVVRIDSAPQVVIQSLPVLLGLLLWCILEFARRKRAASDRVRRAVRVFTFLCTVAISPVTWRFTTVLTCDVQQQTIVWNILACAGLLGASLLVLFGIALRFPRLAILSSFVVASGIVVADVGLRGWWGVGSGLAAQHLMPLQHLWVLHAIAILFHLNRSAPLIGVATRRASVITTVSSKRSSSAPPRRSVVELVDSLAHRDDLRSAPRGGACSERGRERSNTRV